MFHVPAHLFEYCVLLVNGSGFGITYWLVRRHVDNRVTSVHEELADMFSKLEGDVADLFSKLEEDLHADFDLTITQSRDQLAGMDRRVCYVCKRLHTRFEVTAKGAICEGCKGRG
jgi:predicted transcriptional regulator